MNINRCHEYINRCREYLIRNQNLTYLIIFLFSTDLIQIENVAILKVGEDLSSQVYSVSGRSLHDVSNNCLLLLKLFIVMF